MSSHVEGVASAASKLAPSLTAGGLTVANIPLPDIVLLATLIYTILQTYFLIKDRFISPKLRKRKGVTIKQKDEDDGS